MKFHKFHLSFYSKVIFSLFILVLLIFIIRKSKHNCYSSFFSTRCLDYKQKEFSRRLNDKIVDYANAARMSGIKACKNNSELKARISQGELVKIKSSREYIVEVMKYSSPYVTNGSKILINEIAQRFREKTSQKGLRNARFILTSMTRETESIKSLRRNNLNASANSPHLYGNAFDITYKRFKVRKLVLTNCDKKFLKECLAEVIWQLRQEKKCWATYEKGQNCFHVVAR